MDTLDAPTAALLYVVAEHGDEGDDAFVDTERASELVLERIRERGGNFMRFSKGPWFGLEGPARTLQALDVVDIDPGVADVVARGAPAPTADRYFLTTRQELLLSALGRLPSQRPVQIQATRTDRGGIVVPWYLAALDIIRGREVIMLQGEGPTKTMALADTFARALETLAR